MAADDIKVLTGVAVSHNTQQRLVHRQTFELPSVGHPVEAISIDGGKVWLRPLKGEQCIWRDYKAVNLHNLCVEAFFQDNASLLAWVNEQPLAERVCALGGGHDGIWNLFAQVGGHARSAVRNFGLASSG